MPEAFADSLLVLLEIRYVLGRSNTVFYQVDDLTVAPRIVFLVTDRKSESYVSQLFVMNCDETPYSTC